MLGQQQRAEVSGRVRAIAHTCDGALSAFKVLGREDWSASRNLASGRRESDRVGLRKGQHGANVVTARLRVGARTAETRLSAHT